MWEGASGAGGAVAKDVDAGLGGAVAEDKDGGLYMFMHRGAGAPQWRELTPL